jgi:hypothetical protein
MPPEERRAAIHALALAGLLVGPAMAALHETGTLPLGPGATLWPVGFVVLGATMGLLAGQAVASKGSRLVGALVALPNLVVFLFYGFLLLFFGLGGSR